VDVTFCMERHIKMYGKVGGWRFTGGWIHESFQ